MASSIQHKFKSRRVTSIRTFPEAFNLIPKANQDDINHASGDDDSAEPFTTLDDFEIILGQDSKLPSDVAAVKAEENTDVNGGFSVDRFVHRMELLDPNSELNVVMPIASTKSLHKPRTVSAVRKFPRFCGKVIDGGDGLINEGSNKRQFSGVLVDDGEPLESVGFYIQDSVCSNAKEKVQQLSVEKKAPQEKLALNSQSGIPGFNHKKVYLSEKIENTLDKLHDGADLLQAAVSSKKISCPQGKQSDRKTSQKKHLGSPEFENRVIVQALMAAPGCPWNRRKT